MINWNKQFVASPHILVTAGFTHKNTHRPYFIYRSRYTLEMTEPAFSCIKLYNTVPYSIYANYNIKHTALGKYAHICIVAYISQLGLNKIGLTVKC